MPLRFYLYLSILSIFLTSPINLLAIDKVNLDIKNIFPHSAENKLTAPKNQPIHDWLINNLSLSIEKLFTPQQQLIIESHDIKFPSSKKNPIDFKFKLICSKFSFSLSKIECISGYLNISNNKVSNKKVLNISGGLTFIYDISLQQFNLTIKPFTFANSKGSLSLNYKNSRWGLGSHLTSLDIQQLNKWLKIFKPNYHDLDKMSGKIDFDIKASGDQEQVFFANVNIKASHVNTELVKPEFELLTENFNFDLNVILSAYQLSDKNINQFKVTIKKSSGAIFVDPYYIELQGTEKLFVKGRVDDDSQLIINDFSLSSANSLLKNIFSVKGKLLYQIPQNNLLSYSITANGSNLKQFQTGYLDNLLAGTLFEGININGQAKLKFSKVNTEMDLFLNLQNVDLSLADNSIINLNAKIYWANRKLSKLNTNKLNNKIPVGYNYAVKPSYLLWDEINFKNILLGKTILHFTSQDDQIIINEAVKIPVFDGRLIINNLHVEHIFKDLEMSFDGILEPVSLSLLSEQLQWPILHGKLSGLIPKTSYTQKQLKMGGKLWFNLFDGQFAFDDISISDPLTDYSRLTGNVVLNNISLSPLTETLDFGNMQGRVGGYFNHLVLENWQATSFDMFVGTEKDDQTKHTISQRAVDNLSNMGGLPGIMSKSFMSFFENFNYDKLGIGCSLHNGRCTMRGIEEDKDRNAYYIVKGGGIPRIDIMGYETNVDWNTLMERLKAIQQTNQQVIIE